MSLILFALDLSLCDDDVRNGAGGGHSDDYSLFLLW